MYQVQPVAYNPGIDGEAGRINDFYAPQWLANQAGGVQNLGRNQYLLGGNTGWQLGNDLYAANQWMGEPGAYGASSSNPAYENSFLRYRLSPDQIAQFNAGNAAYINGSPYDVLDQNGNVLRSGTWDGIRNNSSTDSWDALVTALVGGVFGGAATGALSSGAAGGAAAEGGAGAGITGFGDAGTMYGGLDAASAGSLGGGASINGGAALGTGAYGAGTAAMGAGGAGGGGITGFGDAGAMYGGVDSTAAGTLGGGGSMGASSSGGMFDSLANIFGGNGSASDWLKLGTTALGAFGGSQGQQGSTTSTRTMDPRLDNPVYGQLVPTTQGLLAGTTPQAQAAGAQLMSRGSGLLNTNLTPDVYGSKFYQDSANDLQRRTADLLGQNNLQIQGNAVATGGLGGSRQGVAQGLAASRAADSLQGNLANMALGQYNQDATRNLQAVTLGSGLLSQGVGLPFAPAQSAASIYSPFTGYGTTTNSTNQGGGWMGALGGGLAASQYGANAGWW